MTKVPLGAGVARLEAELEAEALGVAAGAVGVPYAMLDDVAVACGPPAPASRSVPATRARTRPTTPRPRKMGIELRRAGAGEYPRAVGYA
jgi:hypothetical protein